MTENLVLLGATGSIGTQALDVAEKLDIRVSAMAAGSRVEPFEPLCRKFKPQAVAMMDEAAAKDLRVRLADTDIRVLSGLSGVCELAATPDADTVLNSVTGVAGLQPTLAAIEAGHDVALANKKRSWPAANSSPKRWRKKVSNCFPLTASTPRFSNVCRENPETAAPLACC